jgi:ADP-ribose pyrophosphatase YjhB (NUDIX family)
MTPPAPTPSGGGSPGRRPLRRVDETSAGGLVLDRLGSGARGALIGRLDRRGRLLWSLPKGHVEPGETETQTAVREVAEETGISGRVIGKLGTIDFWFVAEGRRVHKTVHHYLLLVTDPSTASSSPTPTSRSARSRGCRSTSCPPAWPTPTSAGCSTACRRCWPTPRERHRVNATG